MKTILLLDDESGSPKPGFQNVADSKVTQRASEGTPGCNCDRWGHPERGPRPASRVRPASMSSTIPIHNEYACSPNPPRIGTWRTARYLRV